MRAHQLSLSLRTLVLFLALFGVLSVGVNAQDAKDKKASDDAAEGKAERPEVGTTFSEWPAEELGLSEVERDKLLFDMVKRANAKKLQRFKRMYLRRLQGDDITQHTYRRISERRANQDAKTEMLSDGAKVLVAKKAVGKIPLYIILKEFKGFTFGKITGTTEVKGKDQDVAESKPEKEATAYYAEFVPSHPMPKDKDEAKKRSIHVLFERDSADDEDNDWRLADDAFPKLADQAALGADGVWKLFQSMKPKTEKECLAASWMLQKIYKGMSFPWWDLGRYVPPMENELPYLTWAWTEYAKDKDVDPLKRTILFCHQFGVPMPKDDVKLVDKRYLTEDLAAERKKIVDAKDYNGILESTKKRGYWSERSMFNRYLKTYAKMWDKYKPK